MGESRRDGESRGGVLGRFLDRITATPEEVEAKDLMEDSRDRGSVHVRDCHGGQKVGVTGTIRALTLRPVGGVPALEAELYDGSGTIKLVWLGRRRIHGIDPGTSLSVYGRVTDTAGEPTIFNPSYELHA
jgi:RecG-like helicase